MTDDANVPPGPLPAQAARIDLDDPAVIEELVRYDDLDRGALARFEGDPASRVILDVLRRADAELNRGAPGDDGFENDFTAEELYAWGASGRRPAEIDPARTREIGRYLAARPDLLSAADALADAPTARHASFGESLGWSATVDDLPAADREIARGMIDLAPIEGPAEVPAAVSPGPRTTAAAESADPALPQASQGPSWLAWAPLAAAALVAAMVLGGEPRRGAHDGGLPSSPLLRSGAEAPLLFPRGRVVFSPAPAAWCNRPLFEVAPVAEAGGYRFALTRLPEHGSVFAEGEELWRADASLPMATGPALEPGRYEWSASAVINGLERPLGRKAFTVLAGVPAEVAAAAGSDETLEAPSIRLEVRTLHAAAFLTDARHRARTLEPSEERAAYLRDPK